MDADRRRGAARRTSSRRGIASTRSRSRTARSSQSCGDPALVTFFRSSAKPIQALPIVRARPDLDDAEIAIACASHLHRPDQLEPVRSLLAKADATEDDLECGPEPTRLEHNCSGKHAAMLLLCRERRLADRGLPARVAPVPAGDARRGGGRGRGRAGRRCRPAIDGCGVVTYALTLERMAHAFSRLEALDGGVACGGRDARASGARPRRRRAPTPSSCALGDGWVAKGGAEGPAVRGPRRPRGRAQGRGRRAAAARRGARRVPRHGSGFETGELGDAPVENSRGEVVGELRVHRTGATR